MLKLLLIAILTFSLPLFCSSPSDRAEAANRADAFRRETSDVRGLIEKTQSVLDGLLEGKIYWGLRNAGYREDAEEIRNEWRSRYRSILLSRDMEGIPFLSDFINRTYLRIQMKLGYELTHALRLDDFGETLNHLNVVLNPCPYGQANFIDVFCGDKHVGPSPHPHRGFLPVLSYWSTELSISFGTVGLLAWFATPIAMLVEWDVDTAIAPAVAPSIYAGACQ